MPWLLVPAVLAAHWLLAAWWPADRIGFGDAASRIARIDVAFVHELKPAAPPAAVPVTPPPRTRVLRMPRPPSAASAASAAAAAEALANEPPLTLDAATREVPLAWAPLPEVAPAPELAAALVPTAEAAAAAAAAPAASAPEPTAAFEWPPSTRLSYLLTGNYRGPVEGQARVEWRMAGERYQVSLEVGIGPPFAPVVTRSLLSEGVVTAAGLEPRRYEEETRVALRAPRRLDIVLGAERVRLPSGRELPRLPGVQDSASQFVQMTWLFTTQRAPLRPGTALQFPLALPRHMEVWTYEVVGEEALSTPVGAIDAVHVRPRRPPQPPGRPAADLTAEFWVAPTLQYLPVRILIRQDEQTYVDLLLERLPQQAVPAAR
ncbi:MAG: DUF3108 domain-containing protein [Rubrivivax sp.]|nr:DUF3108 domain-containing protein [Rubrivivax sp.]